MKPGLKKALSIFRWTATNVPAYKAFLKEHKINPTKIKSEDDFSKLPYIDKKNYLRRYKFEELFPNKKIPPMISSSSGSTGEPFYWPRNKALEIEGGKIHKMIFEDIFKVKNEKTLVVICFSMGTWIAGTYTTACCRWIAERKENISIITPGIDKEDALAVLINLAPKFKKIILTGYPPFLMDVIYTAQERKIELEHLNLCLLFAGENFSETFRETIQHIAKIEQNLYRTISIYGTADAAILGYETPITIFLRKKSLKNKVLKKTIFGKVDYLPTLVQFNPNYKYFESINDEIAFTTKAGIPLVRYNIHDTGKIIYQNEMNKIVKDNDLVQEMVDLRLKHTTTPFIILYGRKDVSVTFYALNIYVENIKSSLEKLTHEGNFTGKFVCFTKVVNKEKDQKLIIRLELKHGIVSTKEMCKKAQKIIFSSLVKLNSEYRKLYSSIGKKAIPLIELLPYDDKIFQIERAKHKWTINTSKR